MQNVALGWPLQLPLQFFRANDSPTPPPGHFGAGGGRERKRFIPHICHTHCHMDKHRGICTNYHVKLSARCVHRACTAPGFQPRLSPMISPQRPSNCCPSGVSGVRWNCPRITGCAASWYNPNICVLCAPPPQALPSPTVFRPEPLLYPLRLGHKQTY